MRRGACRRAARRTPGRRSSAARRDPGGPIRPASGCRGRDGRAGSCAGCIPPSAAGRARDRARTGRRGRERARPTRASPQIALARQRLQHAVRRHHAAEPGAATERQRADVAADEQRAIGQPGAPQPPARPREHRLRAIDADERARRTWRAAARCGRCRTRARAPARAARAASRRQNATSRRATVCAFSQS